MSIQWVEDTFAIKSMVKKLNTIAGWTPNDGARRVAALLESQTRRRIEEEKTAPNGTPWKPNLEGTSVLLRTGRNLRDSISHEADGGDAIVKANWKYAAVHQRGATIVPKNRKALVFNLGGRTVFAGAVRIPARPFIGMSPANEQEIVEELNAMFAELGGK